MRLIISLLCLLWLLLAEAIATKYGTIGMGITMYKPLCAFSCYNSLSSLHLNCTTFEDNGHSMDGMDMKLLKRMDMGGESMAMTSDECYATDLPWLQTLAFCFQRHCAADGIAESQLEKAWATMAANGAEVPSLQSMVPSVEPEVELDPDAVWLNTTSLVNSEAYESNHRTLGEFEFQEDMHVRLSVVTIVCTVAMCFIAAGFILLQASRFSNLIPAAISKHLLLPALFNGKHQQPLPFSFGYLPSRILSVNIFLYVVLNFIFCCVPYKSIQPNAWWSSSRSELAAYVANRTGILSFANLALAILFVGRSNPIILLTGLDQTTTLTFHRWAARVATLQAVVHSIIYTVTYFWDGGAAAYYTEAAMPYYWWGIIATLALCLAVAFAILPFRKRAYELFLVAHIILVILAIAGCWYHVDIRFNKNWGYEVWLYLAMAFWGFERLSRVFIVLRRNMTGSTTQAVAELLPGGKFIKLIVEPGKAWDVKAGQHCFLYLPSTGRIWESHPFTIAAWNDGVSMVNNESSASSLSHEQDEKALHNPAVTVSPIDSAPTIRKPTLTFILRAQSGITRTLSRNLIHSHRQLLALNIEGPYGHSPNLTNANTIVLIGGGIGITLLTAHIQAFVTSRRHSVVEASTSIFKPQRLVLAWNHREVELRNAVDSLLPKDAEKYGVELDIRCTAGEERLDMSDVVRREVVGLARSKRVAVLVCGPGGMADEVRRCVVDVMGNGPLVDYHEEAFTW